MLGILVKRLIMHVSFYIVTSVIVANEVIFDQEGFLMKGNSILHANSLFVVMKVDIYDNGITKPSVHSYKFGSYSTDERQKRSLMIAQACDYNNCQMVIVDRDTKNSTAAEINELTLNVFISMISCCLHDVNNILVNAFKNKMKDFDVLNSLKTTFSPKSFAQCDLRKNFFLKTLHLKSAEIMFDELRNLFGTTIAEDMLSLCLDQDCWKLSEHRDKLHELEKYLILY